MATLVLLVVDLCCVPGAGLASAALCLGWDEGLRFAAAEVHEKALLALLVPVAGSFFGIYTGALSTGRISAKAVLSTVLGAVLAGGVLFASTQRSDADVLALAFTTVLILALLVTRSLYARALAAGKLTPRSLVIGTADQVIRILKLIRQYPGQDLRVVGIVLSKRPADRIDGPLSEYPVLGGLEDLEAVVAQEHVEQLLLGFALHRELELAHRVRALRYQGIAILDYEALHERLAREIPIQDVSDLWLIGASLASSRMHIRWMKRVLDVTGSLLLAIPAALLVFPATLAILLSSPGPILFRQERLGLGGRIFTLFKLRTMRMDAEKLTGPMWSTDGDPRITTVGRILRMFRIDELPQIWNVLRGDMSLVGPRPERPTLAKQIAERVPLFPERLMVRPGITGWAQVMAPYAASVADSARKLQFDLYYAKNLSLFLDLLILWKTARTMLFGRERAQGGLVAGRQMDPSSLVVSGPKPAIPIADARPASPMSHTG